MAKNKHSAALFEVMARTRENERPARPSVFSSLGAGLGTLFRRREGSDVVAAPRVEVSSPQPGMSSGSSGSPGRATFVVDADRHEVSLRLSYMAAAVCVLALLTTVAAAYVAGRKADWAVAQRPLFSASSDQLRVQPAQPGVTAVRSGVLNGLTDPRVEVVHVEVPSRNLVPQGSSNVSNVVVNRVRQGGLNYVIIQSYPEEKMAQAAQAVLVANGIDCTIERLKGYHTSGTWYTVVGIHGFKYVNKSPELDDYIARVKRISELHTKKARSFKAFEPMPYKWPSTSRG